MSADALDFCEELMYRIQKPVIPVWILMCADGHPFALSTSDSSAPLLPSVALKGIGAHLLAQQEVLCGAGRVDLGGRQASRGDHQGKVHTQFTRSVKTPMISLSDTGML